MPVGPPRLLVFNCHEGWIAQLDGLPYDARHPGRAAGTAERRLGHAGAAGAAGCAPRAPGRGRGRPGAYAAVVVHNPSDLLLARRFDAPRLFIIHNTLEGRLAEEGGAVDGDAFRRAFGTLVDADRRARRRGVAAQGALVG